MAIALSDEVVEHVNGATVGGNPMLGALGQMGLGQAGLGQYELHKIDIAGENLAAVRKSYQLHGDIERELQWQGPMKEVPFNLGWTHPITDSRAG